MKRVVLAILFSLFITNANAGILTVAGSTAGAYIGASEGNKSNEQSQNPIVLKTDKKNVHVVTCRVYDGFC